MFDPNGKGLQPVVDYKVIKCVDDFLIDNIIRPQDKKKYLQELSNQRKKGFNGIPKLAPVGLPITLENKNLKQLLSKNSSGEFKYSLTQKVDGSRMLMFIGGSSEKLPGILTSELSDRIVVFIDRAWNYYSLFDKTQSILPTIKLSRPALPEMLLDGEIVFFDSNGGNHKELYVRDIKGVSFMAFDLLFGPNEIDVNRELGVQPTLKLGQSSSMTIPEDGIPRTKPWPYLNRYDILHKLILPQERLNNNRAIITEAFKEVNWFNVELKPIYPLGSINKWKDIYLSYNPKTPKTTGGSQKDLIDKRKNFYKKLKEDYNKKNTDIFIKEPLELDGLIFTSANTLYTSGAWNSPLDPQFKWKPIEHQTIDFMIKKPGGREYYPNKVLLEIRNFPLFPPKELNWDTIKSTSIITDKSRYDFMKDGMIGEFLVLRKGNSFDYSFVNFRLDKNVSNGHIAAINVLRSVANPVKINKLLGYLSIDYQAKDHLNMVTKKALLETMDRTSLIKCAVLSAGKTFVPENSIDIINRNILQYSQSKEVEIEFRIGKIGKFFDPDLTPEKGANVIKFIGSKGWKQTKKNYIDLVGERSQQGKRARYVKLGKMNRYVLDGQVAIIKDRIFKLDISLSNDPKTKMFPYDIRFSVSSETPIKEIISDYKIIKKDRTSFLHPSGSFVIDITEITFAGKSTDEEKSFNGREFSQKTPGESKFQIEAELIVKDTRVVKDLIVSLQELIDNI